MSAERAVRAVVAVAAAVALAGCGGHGGDHADGHDSGAATTSAPRSSAPVSTDGAPRNDADAAFAAAMVPHHLQAIEMADLVPERTQDPEVRDLADRIRAAQSPEIDRMTAWLAGWGAAPVEDHEAMEGHGGHGMMSADDLRELAALRGAEFDRRWLELMVAHHEGAVEMSREVLAGGQHPGVRTLAQEIVTSQQAEITEMKGLLADR